MIAIRALKHVLPAAFVGVAIALGSADETVNAATSSGFRLAPRDGELLADEIQFSVHPSVWVALVLGIGLAIAKRASRRNAPSPQPTNAVPTEDRTGTVPHSPTRPRVAPIWDAATFTTLGATVAFVIATSSYDSNLWIHISTAGNFEYYSAVIALVVGGLATWSVATRRSTSPLLLRTSIVLGAGAFLGLVLPLDNSNIREMFYWALAGLCVALTVATRRRQNSAVETEPAVEAR